MQRKTFINPHRKRDKNIRYTDPEYVKYYDIDVNDLTNIATKLQQNQRLTDAEDKRYAEYLYAMIEIIFKNRQWRNLTFEEKNEIAETMMIKLCSAWQTWNSEKGSIYSWLYFLGYQGICEYWKKEFNRRKHDAEIQEHINDVYNDYFSEIDTHKVRTTNND